MSSVFIRSLCADGVSVHWEDDTLRITVNGVEELKAEQYEDGWLLWDAGQCVSFDNFQQVWQHIEDLADHYDLFPAQWKSDHYETLCTLFRSTL